MFFVYAIKSQKTGTIYIGQTKNVEERIKRHNGILPTKKKSFTSKHEGPWVVFHLEEYATRLEALQREKQLKTGKGREYLKAKLISEALGQ